jgi:hypothetical protein
MATRQRETAITPSASAAARAQDGAGTAAAATTQPASSAEADAEKLLAQWLHGIKISHVGHKRAAAVFARRARALGVAATVISAIVGTTLFSTLATVADERVIAAAALLSVIAVVLTALQTFLNYSELAAGHRTAATAYGDLRRRMEQLVVFGSPAGLREQMADIGETWAKLDQESPDLPQGIFDYAMKWVTKRGASS